MNRPIVRLYGLVVAAVRAARRVHLALDGLRSLLAARQQAQRAHAARAAAHRPRPDPRRRRHGARAQRARRAKASTRAPTRPASSSPTRSATTSRPTSAAPASSASATSDAERPDATPTCRRARPAAGQASRAATRWSRRSTPRAQRVADAALGGHKGAVVALEPRSGAVTVMASSPELRPQLAALARTATQRLAHDTSGRPLVNRATQFGYAPGSTFKVVTATAAIDSGAVHARLDGQRAQRHRDLRRAAAERRQRELRADHAHQALAQLGQHRLGAGRRTASASATIARYMSRFGFDRKPQLDYPPSEMSISGEYDGDAAGRADEPARRRRAHGHRPGQTRGHAAADGRGRRRGRQPRPADGPAPHRAASSTPKGAPCERIVAARAVGRDEAARPPTAVTTMMEAVVNEGTGTSRRSPASRWRARRAPPRRRSATAINNVWFIAFAPAVEPDAWRSP